MNKLRGKFFILMIFAFFFPKRTMICQNLSCKNLVFQFIQHFQNPVKIFQYTSKNFVDGAMGIIQTSETYKLSFF